VRAVKNTVIYYCVAAVAALLRLLLACLPHRAVVRLGRGVGALAFLVGRHERLRALDNVARALPALSEPRREVLVREMFRELGSNALECLIVRRLKARAVCFEPGARKALLDAHALGRGVIYVTAHLGNWELMAAAVARHVLVSVLFKGSYDPRFTWMIDDFRKKNGVMGINVQRPGHLRRAIVTLRSGHVLGVLLDQPVVGGASIPFFDQPAPTSLIVPALARITGAPVVVGTIQRVSPCQHAISVRRILLDERPERGYEQTRRLTRHLQAAIEGAPEQWIWSLDRWRSTEKPALSSALATQCKLYTSE
jgi:KDO2-lipid IV(A) lauroyltransferase